MLMSGIDFDYEEPIEKRFEELCQDLCIEGAIREEAWEKYKDVWANYSIDGDQLQWLVCSLYECCRRSVSDSLSGHIVDNAYISLSRLLGTAKMSMVQFFHRVKRWADMTDMIDDMRDRIDLIERQFAVSSVIFRNFGRSFGVLFHESNYNEQMHPTGTDLFRFTWLLFIKSRATFPAVTDDLVNSYHLLACCLDWVLGAVMLSGRGAVASSLVNLDFGGFPKDFILAVNLKQPWCPQGLPGHQHQQFDNNAQIPPCMLRPICEDNDINYVECKTVKEHFFRPFIVRLLEKELIKVHPSSVGSLLEPEHFDMTLQNLNNNYEEYIISTGDFDERIYLSANAAEEIGSTGESGVQSSSLRLPSELAPSARRYMLEVSNSGFGGFTETNRRGNANAGAICRLNGGVNFNNPEARNQNLNQLQLLLSGRLPEPSATLADLTAAHCQPSPLPDVRHHVEEFSLEFQRAYTRLVDPDAGNDCFPGEASGNNLAVSAAQQRLQLGCTFFFMALEQILSDEVGKMERRLHATGGTRKFDISVLLSHQLFLRSLFACCMELVLLSCDSPDRHFPWILSALTLDALQFFKVIEVVIRNVDFPRDVVKYMRQVTELILDSYAWRSDSPLWSLIKSSGRAPTIEEVIPPEKLDQTSGGTGSHFGLSSRAGDLRRLATSGVTSGISGPVSIKPSPSPPTAAKQARLLTMSGIRNRAMTSKPRPPVGQLVDDESAAATAHLLASDIDPQPSPAPQPAASGEQAREDMESDNRQHHDETLMDNHIAPATGTSTKDQSGLRVLSASSLLVSSGGDDTVTDDTEAQGVSRSSKAAPKWTFDDPGETGVHRLPHYHIRHDSLAIFFRQVYRVASLRLRQLCDRLNLGRDILARVWTCFEHAVVHNTDALLRDRCIDQVLLCCLYGVCKVAHYRAISFIDVIHVYRMQPQSNRDIYRRVLINSDSIYGGSTNTGEYGDLSRFYNVIFLPQMKDFIKKAAAVGQPDSIERPSVLTGSLSNPVLSSATIPPNSAGLVRPGDASWSDGAAAPTLAPIPVFSAATMSASVTSSIATGLSTSGIPSGHLLVTSSGIYGNSTVATDVSQAKRIATNRNVFISPVKQQVNLSPKRVVFTVGRSTGKDLQNVNLMISSAEKRASVANLTSIPGMNRPVTHTPGIISPATSTYTVSTNRGVVGAGPRTITLLGGPRRIDFDM